MNTQKKQYEKPRIAYEGFELSQSIAVGCSAIANAMPYVCQVDFDGTFFIYTQATCEDTPNDVDVSFCYDVPDGSNVVFSS